MITLKHQGAPARALPLPIAAVAALALALAYGDGFWLAALQGAIGAVERQGPPFARWLRDATLALPLVFLALLLALVAARRLIEGRRRALARLGALTLVVALAGGGVALAEAGLSSLLDYRHQVRHLQQQHGAGEEAPTQGAASPTYALFCTLRGASTGDALAQLEYATLMVHVRALATFGAVVLVTNLAVALGILGLVLRPME